MIFSTVYFVPYKYDCCMLSAFEFKSLINIEQQLIS